MTRRPEDVEGECNAWLVLSDDYGDNECSFRCNLPDGHHGMHENSFARHHGGEVVMSWRKDERPGLEREDEFRRGAEAAHGHLPICEEPGEAYLEGFCDEALWLEEPEAVVFAP